MFLVLWSLPPTYRAKDCTWKPVQRSHSRNFTHPLDEPSSVETGFSIVPYLLAPRENSSFGSVPAKNLSIVQEVETRGAAT